MYDECIPAHVNPTLKGTRGDAKTHDGKIIGLCGVPDPPERRDKHGLITIQTAHSQSHTHAQIPGPNEKAVNYRRAVSAHTYTADTNNGMYD